MPEALATGTYSARRVSDRPHSGQVCISSTKPSSTGFTWRTSAALVGLTILSAWWFISIPHSPQVMGLLCLGISSLGALRDVLPAVA